jgi:ATP-binding cassette subfamily F protein uup
VVFWHYQQEETKFPENKTVLEYIEDVSSILWLWNWEKISASKLLERFLFTPAQQHQPANKLSWWEKRRLALLRVLISNPNFLILDEPTNDLDLLTITILENFLSQYKWCLIII